ncbi:nuclear transport factor 2 family protein [Pedobacter mucosus]|uniref:nuclear transport factor 2 family protein n=1 Tax=Pedobacter mucosus TaxID=2895286 RepID=UPI001EE3D82C|nr:nuclear transport factor 2 family protein [Pedobacter mucosus]UKT62755.1 nuclear transport factor 2 family protein [Pedobacter mucosus]
MDIKTFITNWIEVGNSYNTEKYLDFFLDDAVLDDPSVGRIFVGYDGISEYYTSYFIGYETQTELMKIDIKENSTYVEVEFTGKFPEGKIGGSFELNFSNEKIASIKADLI